LVLVASMCAFHVSIGSYFPPRKTGVSALGFELSPWLSSISSFFDDKVMRVKQVLVLLSSWPHRSPVHTPKHAKKMSLQEGLESSKVSARCQPITFYWILF
jgi:hypothetical protein